MLRGFVSYLFSSQTNDFNELLSVLESEYFDNIKIRESIISRDDFIDKILDVSNKLSNKKIIISLSGGVDSMVLTTILHYFDFEVIGVHINYNNREETGKEQEFLEKWCNLNGIKLYVKSINDIKRNNTKRKDYELITKNIRLDFYKEVMKKENVEYVMLGHHKDDIVENIFANFARGRNLLDLAVIREQATINGVKIVRPMLEYNKDTIYKFAFENNVPYFKDTTPLWSVRGKYRQIIEPALKDAFTEHVKTKLLNMSEQSDEWNLLIQKEIIRPFFEKVLITIDDDKIVIKFNPEKYKSYPVTFWQVIFIELFNTHGYNAPSKKGIQTFLNNLDNNNKEISLANSCKCLIKNENIYLTFKK